ncbi:hypothetical protein IQ35_01104 [Sphingobium wenxiniae]|uniref:Uncharacterized protein n=1 Tax=Sphingobium wenxiniae (strain DSM 21828 / CGMCC 1.7748 / JZ-1) TaxID=595605 RepID=A0A562KL76_SPHWJ|nr:hypothetical protein IQ35_01104 [Sphingobium wenxiniae]
MGASMMKCASASSLRSHIAAPASLTGQSHRVDPSLPTISAPRLRAVAASARIIRAFAGRTARRRPRRKARGRGGETHHDRCHHLRPRCHGAMHLAHRVSAASFLSLSRPHRGGAYAPRGDGARLQCRGVRPVRCGRCGRLRVGHRTASKTAPAGAGEGVGSKLRPVRVRTAPVTTFLRGRNQRVKS